MPPDKSHSILEYKVSELQKAIDHLCNDFERNSEIINEIDKKLDKAANDIELIQRIVYSGIALILVAVVGAIIKLVVT